jgi:hypothetical protein
VGALGAIWGGLSSSSEDFSGLFLATFWMSFKAEPNRGRNRGEQKFKLKKVFLHYRKLHQNVAIGIGEQETGSG